MHHTVKWPYSVFIYGLYLSSLIWCPHWRLGIQWFLFLFLKILFILCLFIFPLSVLFHLDYLGDFHLWLFSINLCPIILVHPLYWSICQPIFSFCFIFVTFLGTNIFIFYLVCCALKTFKQFKYLLKSQIKKQICPNQEMLLEIISCIWCLWIYCINLKKHADMLLFLLLKHFFHQLQLKYFTPFNLENQWNLNVSSAY